MFVENHGLLSGMDIIFNVWYQFHDKLSKIFIDQWKESLNSETNKQGNMGNILRTYRKFKNLFKFEEYLQFGSKTEQQTYTKFRISAHDLRIERGSNEGLKIEFVIHII